ncbi:hypothetical protein ACRTDR_04420 [Shewanella algae]
MEDLFEQFVDSDAMALLISTTPPALLDYALAVYRLNEIPVPEVANAVDGKPCFQSIHIPFTGGFNELSELDSGTSNEDVIKHLAKIDGIIESLTRQHQQNTKTYIGYFTPLHNLPLVEDLELIRNFYNASSLTNAFCAIVNAEKPLNILPSFTNISQSILQDALACQMAGLTAPAKRLFDEFFNELFTDINVQVDELLAALSTHIAHAKKSSEAGHKGKGKRHSKSALVKAFAQELYENSSYENAYRAAQALTPKIIQYGKTVGFLFVSDYQAPRTIYGWLKTSKRQN